MKLLAGLLSTHYRIVILWTVFGLALTIPCLSQQAVFSPAEQNISLLKSLYDKFERSYKQEIAALPSQNKKDLEEIYGLRWENVKEAFDKKEIYTSVPAQQYLDAVIAEIVKSNPGLQNQNFSCFFSRSGIPNAMYIGEGVIVFNMGLFSRLTNESEVAFVLCHELAHFYLKHSESTIAKYVANMNSDEVQKELKKIKRAEYNKRERLEQLMKGMTFGTRRHSRDHESQADSLALQFLSHTRFSVSAAFSTLQILDAIDMDTFKIEDCLSKTFNAPDYPFQKKWIQKEEGLLGGHAVLKDDEKIADSLKTHPDCKTRIKILEPMVKGMGTSGSANIIDKARFDELRNTFKYEVVEYAFEAENYTKSLHYALQLMETYPGDPYLVAQVGKVMNACYKAQKEHTLSKVTDLPAPYYRPNYNLLLQFIQNLYLNDFASISYHFLKKYHLQLEYYTPFKTAYNTSIQIAKD